MKNLSEVKELLVVVDVINGFIYEGNMKDDYISHIIPGIKALVESHISDSNSEVFYVRDSHSEDSKEFKKFPLHCLRGTNESEMVDELKEYEDRVRTYFKNSTSAIFAKGLLEDIKKMRELKKVVVVGCCSDICIINFALPLINYFDENDLDIDVVVREDLIETYNSINHNREEYNNIAKLLLTQAGVNVEKGGNQNVR